MKKITLLLALLAYISVQAVNAQTVTGKVTSAEDGSSVPGATVMVKGGNAGTITDFDGSYTLEVPSGTQALVVSFVGMKTKEVAYSGQATINVVLEMEDVAIGDVVVTALGISREKKALGYSVQDVSGEALNNVKETNVVNSLAGKVAGIQITSSSGNMGGSSRVLIRGNSSISGNNNPLFVVDGIPIDNSNFTSTNQARGAGGYDYGNAAQDINPNDIESVTVLKGASASVLYGSRAANGVIMITTKKGSKRKGIGVSVNSSATWEKVAFLPKYQNEYGGGYSLNKLYTHENDIPGVSLSTTYTDENGSFILIPDYSTDESWGPAFAETPNSYLGVGGEGPLMYRPWYSWDEWDTENFGKSVAWEAQPDNIKDFYETGVTYTNNIALSGGNEMASFRLSYTNMDLTGVMPNSEMQRNTINFSGSAKLNNKLTAFTDGTYVKTTTVGRPYTGYDGNNVSQQFNQWGQRQWNMDKMKSYKNPDGTGRTWNRTSWSNGRAKFTDNPYWTRYMNYQNDERNRFFGRIGLTYEINDWLKFTGKANTDYYTDRREERIAVYSQATSEYSEGVREVQETTLDFLFQVDKAITDDLHFSATFGGSQMTRWLQRNVGTTGGGLAAPEYYNLLGGNAAPILDDYYNKKRINSLYGQANFGFKNMLYVDFSFRNDWSSTLPDGENSYPYPSVTTSFVFSELVKASWLSFGKVRFGWARVGSDTDPYELVNGYNVKEPFGAYPRATVPNSYKNPELQPEATDEIEFGTEMKFFNNRLGFDFAWYDKTTTNQIFSVDLPAPSGYQSQVINAGEVNNKGMELMLYITPIQTNGFQWDITVNWAKNDNKLVSLADGIDKFTYTNAPFAVELTARVGEPFPTIEGTNFSYTDDGEKIIDGGVWAPGEYEVIGKVNADWTGGISNTFSFNGLSANFVIDMRKGGQLFSTSYMWGVYSGVLEESAGLNELGNPKRDAVTEDGESGGVLVDGVMDDGNGNWVPNTVRTDMNTWGLYHYFVAANNVFDADYMKLRELSIGYTIPQKFLGNLPISSLKFSVVGRNLATWGTDIKHIDPSHATNSGNIQGIEGAQTPPVKSFGFNLSFNL